MTRPRRVRIGSFDVRAHCKRVMIAALRQNALPIAMILVCAAALYLVYRDMKKIDARLNRLDAAVVVLSEEQSNATCMIHDDYEAALQAEADEEDFEAEFDAEIDAELDAVAETVAEPVAEPVADPVVEPVADPVAAPVVEPVAQPVAEA